MSRRGLGRRIGEAPDVGAPRSPRGPDWSLCRGLGEGARIERDSRPWTAGGSGGSVPMGPGALPGPAGARVRPARAQAMAALTASSWAVLSAHLAFGT